MLLFFFFFGCQKETVHHDIISGSIADSCVGIMAIDLMDFSSSNLEPIEFTEANQKGEFQFTRPPSKVLQIYGFCYENEKMREQEISLWKTEPMQLLADDPTPTALTLRRSLREEKVQPLSENVLFAEQDQATNRFFRDFYAYYVIDDIEKHNEFLLGSRPSTDHSFLSPSARKTYLKTLYAIVKTACQERQQEFLLPSPEEWKDVLQEQGIFTPKTAAMIFRFEEICSIFSIHCPTWRQVRSEELSILDKRLVKANDRKTRQAAILWLLSSQLAFEGRVSQKNAIPFLPLPTEISKAVRAGTQSSQWRKLITKLEAGFAEFNLPFPTQVLDNIENLPVPSSSDSF